MKTLKFGSLFAGIGGFDLGLERAGLECRWQVEIDEFCQKVLAKHWPKVRRHDDVRTFPPIGSCGWGVDVVCGGDPCQENSRARVTAATVAGSLGRDFLDVIDTLKPRFVIRENPTFSRTDAPWPWQKFRHELENQGYVVEPVRLRACCFGYPHRRDRLLLLGQRADTYCEPLWVPRCTKIAQATATMQGEAQERKRLWVDPRAMVRSPRSGDDPRLVGIADGVSVGVDKGKRMRALGNAIVPEMSEFVGRLIQCVAASAA